MFLNGLEMYCLKNSIMPKFFLLTFDRSIQDIRFWKQNNKYIAQLFTKIYANKNCFIIQIPLNLICNYTIKKR